MTLEKESAYLSNIPLFHNLDSTKCKLIAMSSERLQYQPGDTIYESGDPSDAVYFLLSGAVRFTRKRDDNTVVRETPEDDMKIFGHVGILSGRTRVVTLEATEETTMLRLDAAAFQDLLNQVPSLAIELAAELSRTVDSFAKKLIAAKSAATETPNP